MYWFAGTGTDQQTSTVKLEVLWKFEEEYVYEGFSIKSLSQQ